MAPNILKWIEQTGSQSFWKWIQWTKESDGKRHLFLFIHPDSARDQDIACVSNIFNNPIEAQMSNIFLIAKNKSS